MTSIDPGSGWVSGLGRLRGIDLLPDVSLPANSVVVIQSPTSSVRLTFAGSRLDAVESSGCVDADTKQISAWVILTEDGELRLGGAHQHVPIPPWHLAGPEAYEDTFFIAGANLTAFYRVTACPFGNVDMITAYVDGRLERRDRKSSSGDLPEAGSTVDVVVVRSFPRLLLYYAGIVDLLSSLEEGFVDGEWSKLMLLGGIVDSLEVKRIDQAGTLDSEGLCSLALFSRCWMIASQ